MLKATLKVKEISNISLEQIFIPGLISVISKWTVSCAAECIKVICRCLLSVIGSALSLVLGWSTAEIAC